jgi:hypothetical protein
MRDDETAAEIAARRKRILEYRESQIAFDKERQRIAEEKTRMEQQERILREEMGKKQQQEQEGQRQRELQKEKQQLKQQRFEERIAFLLSHPLESATQVEQRELKRRRKQADKGRAELTQQNILDECSSQGQCKVTEDDLKHAFPKEVSLIDKNFFRPQVDIKEFNKFLLAKKLSFSLPDFVFKNLT